MEAKNSFDEYYYQHCCGSPYQHNEQWLAFFDQIAQRIIQDIQPRTVLDAGCAYGFLVEKLRKRGIQAWGVDISEYAIQNVAPEVKPYCWVGSISDTLPQNFDLIVSIEVLEHMPQADAERAIENLCNHSKELLFSSSPFDYEEATHFNVHPPEYWAQRFALHGFFRDVDYDASFITPWAVRFRRSIDPLHIQIQKYERRFWLLWKENFDLRVSANKYLTEMRVKEAESLSLLSKIAELENNNQQAHQKLSGERERIMADLQTGVGWRVLSKLQALRLKFIPRGSRRESIFYALFRNKK